MAVTAALSPLIFLASAPSFSVASQSYCRYNSYMAVIMAGHGHHHNTSHFLAPVLRTDSNLSNSSFSSSSSILSSQKSGSSTNFYIEKRQLFLRSYQFSRKKTVSEKIKTSFSRATRAISIRLRSARRFRRVVWSRLRSAFFHRRRNRVVLFRSAVDGGCRSWLLGGGSKKKNRECSWKDSGFWYKRVM